MDLDLLGPGERPLELRALHERARHAEAELPVEPVVGAAREHADSRVHRPAVVDADADAVAATSMARTRAPERSSAPAGAAGVGERLIEDARDRRPPR